MICSPCIGSSQERTSSTKRPRPRSGTGPKDSNTTSRKKPPSLDNSVLESIIREGCECGKQCFLSLCDGPNNYSTAIEIMKSCRSEILHMGQDEIVSLIVSKLQGFSYVVHGGRKHYDYVISYFNQTYSVCHTAFILCFGITNYALKSAKATIQKNLFSTSGVFSDNTAVNDDTLKLLEQDLRRRQVNVIERREVLGRCSMSNTDESFMV